MSFPKKNVSLQTSKSVYLITPKKHYKYSLSLQKPSLQILEPKIMQSALILFSTPSLFSQKNIIIITHFHHSFFLMHKFYKKMQAKYYEKIGYKLTSWKCTFSEALLYLSFPLHLKFLPFK